jgi:hypothetical protein
MRELSQGARQLIVLAVVISALDRIASHDCCFSVTKPSQKLPTKFSKFRSFRCDATTQAEVSRMRRPCGCSSDCGDRIDHCNASKVGSSRDNVLIVAFESIEVDLVKSVPVQLLGMRFVQRPGVSPYRMRPSFVPFSRAFAHGA